MSKRKDLLEALGFNPDMTPREIEAKKYTCPQCGKENAYYREIHPDTSMNDIILYCPDCGYRSDEEEKHMEKKVKAIPFEIKEIDEEERSFLAVASTEDLDRDNDRIMSDGWDLGNFLKNPVVPWAHRYGDPPVARATEIMVNDGRLMFRPKFATKEEYDFADTIFKLYKGGFLRSFSVGFMPKRYEIVERGEKGPRGYDFLEQELWEISACTVPSNPNALVAAKTKGVISDEELAQVEKEVKKMEEKADPQDTTGQEIETETATESTEEPEDKRLNIEKRMDELEQLIKDKDAESNSLNERLDAIEETLKTISEAIKQPEPDETESHETETPETDENTESKTLTLDKEELTRTVADVVQSVIDRSVGDSVKYHLGIVD